MMLLISDLGGGDLWLQAIDDEAAARILGFRDKHDDVEIFRKAVTDYFDLEEEGEGNTHIVYEFGLQSPVIKKLAQPLAGITEVLYLT